MARPKRTWFQSDKEKKKVEEARKELLETKKPKKGEPKTARAKLKDKLKARKAEAKAARAHDDARQQRIARKVKSEGKRVRTRPGFEGDRDNDDAPKTQKKIKKKKGGKGGGKGGGGD